MIKRKIFDLLMKQSKERKISLLLGARQVGKTTALKWLFGELSKIKKCLFLDLDIISNYDKVNTFETLINTLKLNGYEENQKDFFYLFLDEFQKYPKLTVIMKNIYDNQDNIKIYASGSSSIAIKSEIQESLAGRKTINELYPLDFEEFLRFKQNDKIIEKMKNIRKLNGENLQKVLPEMNILLSEFLIFGGYPELIFKNSKKDKISVLDSIFDLYVKKDLVDYLKIEKILNIKKLIEFLAVNNGQKIKYEEASAITSLPYLEIKKYIELLEETYIIKVLKPYYHNKNKEIVKIPKIYFIDPGVRNYFIKNFNELKLRDDGGFLFENFVISEFLKNGVENLMFWQDKNANEVDIIIEKNRELIPIEIKFKNNLKKEDINSLIIFFRQYPNVKRGYLINMSLQKKDKKINYLLPYSLDAIKSILPL